MLFPLPTVKLRFTCQISKCHFSQNDYIYCHNHRFLVECSDPQIHMAIFIRLKLLLYKQTKYLLFTNFRKHSCRLKNCFDFRSIITSVIQVFTNVITLMWCKFVLLILLQSIPVELDVYIYCTSVHKQTYKNFIHMHTMKPYIPP